MLRTHALLHARGARVLPAFRYLCRRAKATAGLERAIFQGAVSPIPVLAFSSRVDMQGRSVITRRYTRPRRPNKPACLAGDEIVFADGAPFQPVQSFRGKVGREVVLGLRRAGAFYANIGYAGSILSPTKCFLDGLKASGPVSYGPTGRSNRLCSCLVLRWIPCISGRSKHLLSQSPAERRRRANSGTCAMGWGGANPRVS